MSEKTWIILIVALTVVLVVIILRRQLKNLHVKGMGMEAKLETHSDSPSTDPKATGRRASVNIGDFNQTGFGNELNISRGDTNVERTKQIGKSQKISVTTDKPNQD